MAWEVWWALVFGFAISAAVRRGAARADRGFARRSGPAAVLRATGLGAASSSCSYAAVAIARASSRKSFGGERLAFQFRVEETRWELGLVLWTLIGWQFALAEYVGGLVMIALMALFLRAFVTPRLEARARARAGSHRRTRAPQRWWADAPASIDSWSDVAHNFRGDWQMLYKEIAVGFLLAGFGRSRSRAPRCATPS